MNGFSVRCWCPPDKKHLRTSREEEKPKTCTVHWQLQSFFNAPELVGTHIIYATLNLKRNDMKSSENNCLKGINDIIKLSHSR